MTPADHRLQELFGRAVALPPLERERLLTEECGEDPGLLALLRSLLAADAGAEAQPIWRMSALEAEAAERTGRADPNLGRMLGPWRLVEPIGRGGTGSVYRAVRADSEYQRSVAVKLIRSSLDAEEVAERFRVERQILANLNHPNIARLLDGGADENGLPFLVMEYIEGRSLCAYCQEHDLEVKERLLLFRQICSAVHYAHQRMVIHRDLKPGNILVTEDGTPKLLDFGIAKLMEPGTGEPAVTIAGTRMMTPGYASPEQVRGETVTTESDVYSLGVVLYELLTGNSPYPTTGGPPHVLMRAVCEEEPVKPSMRAGGNRGPEGLPHPKPPKLSGDLDNIVLMALRKDPKERYASADQFSEDIRHYLEGLPVIARGDAFGYVTAKFIRRNKLAVSGALLIVAILIAGFVSTRRAEARAERRFQDVRALANWMLFDFHDSMGKVPGTLSARQMLVGRAIEYLDSLAAEAGQERTLLSELAVAYDRVGSLTFEVEKALAAHRKAEAINARLSAWEPGNRKYREQLATSLGWVASINLEKGSLPEAIDSFRRAASLMEALVELDPGNVEYRSNLVEIYQNMGRSFIGNEQVAEALAIESRAQTLNEAMWKAQPDNLDRRRAMMIGKLYLADSLSASGDYPAALESARAAVEIAGGLIAANPGSADYRRDVWLTNMRVAGVLGRQGNARGALATYQKALPYLEGLAKADPGDEGHQHGLAMTYLAMGRVHAAIQRIPEAMADNERAIAIARTVLSADPDKTECAEDLAKGMMQAGSLALKAGRLNQAAQRLQDARTLLEDLSKRYPANTRIDRDLAELHAGMGDLGTQLAAREPQAVDKPMR